MSAHTPTKALLLSIQADPSQAIALLQELTPEMVCFFLAEDHKPIVETQVHPALSQMPKRWDWILTPDPQSFPVCHKTLARELGPLLTTWKVAPGELDIDLTNATPAMASAMTLVGFPFTTKVIHQSASTSTDSSSPHKAASADTTENPWDEEAPRIRGEACVHFNQGSFEAAARTFFLLEHRVSGGTKPLYRALGDISKAYGLWDELVYRPAWEKLKGGIKALELASVWGGPAGMDKVIQTLKTNLRFLEHIVLDVKEVKPGVALDLLAWAKRHADRGHHLEEAVRALLRSLEAFAQTQLFTHHQLKSWDIPINKLPPDLQEPYQTRYLNDVDGKYRLPLQAQFHTLAGFNDEMGKRYVTDWPKVKSLFDAADRAVLGTGFESIKPERFSQLYDFVLKVTGISPKDLPFFPSLHL